MRQVQVSRTSVLDDPRRPVCSSGRRAGDIRASITVFTAFSLTIPTFVTGVVFIFVLALGSLRVHRYSVRHRYRACDAGSTVASENSLKASALFATTQGSERPAQGTAGLRPDGDVPLGVQVHHVRPAAETFFLAGRPGERCSGQICPESITS